MGEYSSFFAQRRADLGGSNDTNSSSIPTTSGTKSDYSDFFTQRKMDLGIIPDTRKPAENQKLANSYKEYAKTSSPFATNLQDIIPKIPTSNWQNEPAKTNYPGGIINPLNDLGHLSNLLSPFTNAAGHSMGVPDNMMRSSQSTGNKLLDKSMQLAGGAAGYLTNPAQIEQNVGNAFFGNPIVNNLASKAANKASSLLPNAGLKLAKDGSKIVDSLAGKTVNSAVKGVVTGGLGSAAYSPFNTLNSGQDFKDIPKNMLEQGVQGATFGGALGGLAPSLGAGLKTLVEKYAGTKIGDTLSKYMQASENRNVQTQTLPNAPEYPKFDPNWDKQLALPPASDQTLKAYNLRNRPDVNVLSPNTEPIYGKGNIHTPEPLALNESPQYNEIQRIKAKQTLGLPEASPQTISEFNRRNGNILPTNTTPIIGKGNIADPLGLPQGNYTVPTRLKVMGKEDAFNKVIPKVFQQATERMTPPLENEKELAKWVQGHMNAAGHDVSLNQVRELHYEDLRTLADEIKGRLNVHDVVRSTAHDMGYGKIFDQATPSIKEQLAKDTQSQVYGVPAPKVDIRRPSSFNVQHEGTAATPKQGLSFKREPKAPKVSPFVETPLQQQQRIAKQIKDAADRKKISELSKPIIGRAAMPETKIGRPSSLREVAATARVKPKVEPTKGNVIKKEVVTKPIAKVEAVRNPEHMVHSKANESGVFQSLQHSEHVLPKTIDEIKHQGETTFETKSNEQTIQNANDSINKNGINESRQQVMEKEKALNDDETAVAFKLLTHYQNNGDFESAASIAHKLMTSGTENGRAVQINAIFNKMTPEGAAKFAAKLIDKATNGEKNITPEQTQRITQFAKQFQTAAGNKELSQSAIRAINKLSNGEKLTVQEADQLKNFAKYAAKNAPKPTEVNYKDLKGTETAPKTVGAAQPKLRDQVVKVTSTQADKARERIKARGNRVSSTPFDVWADYAIIGADHIANGAKTIADFAEKMTDDAGNLVYKNINRLYVDAYTKFRSQNKIPMSDFEKIVNKAIGTHEIGNIEASAIKAKAIELIQMSGKEKIAAEAQLHQQFQELTDPSFGQKLSSILRSAQLLNPRTTIRNVISNMMFYTLDTTVRRLSSVVDLAASSLTGKDRQIFWKNAPDIWKNFYGDVTYGAKEGYAGRNPGGFSTQFDLGNNAFDRNGSWGEKIGSFFERSLGAVNKSMDYASANMAMKNELFQLAKAKAYADGHRGASLQSKAVEEMHIANDEMLAQAKEYGEYMTFQDKNFVSDAAQNLKMKVLNAGKDFGLGNILLNYPKTPANILMRAIDYSPAGYVKFASNLMRMASNPKVDKKTLIMDFMRASGGTSMLWGAYQLAKAGLINVLPSQDPQVNSLERSAGIVPNSINVDGFIRFAKTYFSDPSVAKKRQGDYYASMDWAQPMAISASAGAAIAQSNDPSRIKTGVNAASSMEQSLEGSLESAGNMTVLKNIKQAIMGNTNNPNQTVMGRVGDIVKQVPSAFVPSVFGQLRNTMDPAIRDTQQGGFMQQVLNQVINKLPGLSKNLPQRIDTLGNPMQNQFNTGTRAANAFANPALMGKYDPNQAAQVILKLINSTGDQSLAPASPQKTLNIAGLKTKLTPKQYQELQTSKGQQIQDFINQNIQVFNNEKLSDDEKANVLRALLKAAGEVTSGKLKAQLAK